MPLAAVTIVFPVFGPRVLRWMIVAPRTYVRLLLVLLSDLIVLAAYIFLPRAGTSSFMADCLDVIAIVLYMFSPCGKTLWAFAKEFKAIRSNDHSFKALLRFYRKHILKYVDLLFGYLFLTSIFPAGIFGWSPAFYYVSIALFLTYRFFKSWLVYRGLARN